MAQSVVQICNSALALIGETQITSLGTATEAERQCALQYEIARDIVLRSHPWNFAEKRAVLARLVGAPAFEYSYYYGLPSDCLRVLHVYDAGSNTMNADVYRIEGDRKIATDASGVNLIYTAKIEDPSQFDSLFVQALIYTLASMLALVLADNRGLRGDLEAAADRILKIAKSVDATEGTPLKRTTKGSWLSNRFRRT